MSLHEHNPTGAWLLVVCLLGGCVRPAPVVIDKPVEVRVPIYMAPKPPDELMTPIVSTAPEFVAPSHPDARAALTAEGINRFKLLIIELKGRDDAWRAWASQPSKPADHQ